MIKYNKKGINTVLHIWGKQTIISTKNYQGGDKTIFFLYSLVISHIKHFFFFKLKLMITQQPTQLKLCAKDNETTVYPAWGQLFLLENLLTNPVILKCLLWEWGSVHFSSVPQCVWLFVTPWTAALQASLSITNSHRLLKLMSIDSAMPSKHLILCHILLSPSLFPSIRVF